jgi:hypothetical protein
MLACRCHRGPSTPPRSPATTPRLRPQVGFSRWEANAAGKGDPGLGADALVKLGGLDLALFDQEGRIELLVQFTMKQYPQLAIQ